MGPSENRYTRSKSRSHDVSIHVFFKKKNTINLGGLERSLEDLKGHKRTWEGLGEFGRTRMMQDLVRWLIIFRL